MLNMLVIMLLPALNLFGGGNNSLQKSSSKQFVSVRSADTFFLYLFNITCVRMRGPSSYAHFACPFAWRNQRIF